MVLNDEQKIRSQGGEKKRGGGMSEPPSSPEKSMHGTVDGRNPAPPEMTKTL